MKKRFVVGRALLCLTALIIIIQSKWAAYVSLFIFINIYSRALDNMVCQNGSLLKDNLYYIYDKGHVRLMSRCIPATSTISTLTSHPPFLEDKLTKTYLQLPQQNVAYSDKVLILTPLRDAGSYIKKFGELLNTLSYPHQLIRIGFAEEGSNDDTYIKALQVADKLRTQCRFKDAVVHRLPIKGNRIPHKQRHDDRIQVERRSHLAKVRNMLTKAAYQNETWILWIDVDLVKFRPDVVEQFLFSGKDVMVASVLHEKTPFYIFSQAVVYELFERNSFNETVTNGRQYKLYTPDFKSFGREVPIQFVGSCMMMIKASCVQQGLHFPETIIKMPGSLVDGLESEGLGMLARQMGFGVYVLPFLEAFHK